VSVSPLELSLLEALSAPGTRWHQPGGLAAALGRDVGPALEGLQARRLATGPPVQPPGCGWSITTHGTMALQVATATRAAA